MSNDTNNLLNMTAPVSMSPYAYQQDLIRTAANTRELVDKWFIAPMRRMKDDDGFLCLMCLLPLYEKHLRYKLKMCPDENFSRGHQVFNLIGSHLRISKDEAFEFWRNFRNGLLHHGAPVITKSFRWAIKPNKAMGLAITRDANVFLIDPFALRDRLLKEIEPDIAMWREDEVALSVIYK